MNPFRSLQSGTVEDFSERQSQIFHLLDDFQTYLNDAGGRRWASKNISEVRARDSQ